MGWWKEVVMWVTDVEDVMQLGDIHIMLEDWCRWRNTHPSSPSTHLLVWNLGQELKYFDSQFSTPTHTSRHGNWTKTWIQVLLLSPPWVSPPLYSPVWVRGSKWHPKGLSEPSHPLLSFLLYSLPLPPLSLQFFIFFLGQPSIPLHRKKARGLGWLDAQTGVNWRHWRVETNSLDCVKRSANNQVVLQRTSHFNRDACVFFGMDGASRFALILVSASL